VPDNLRVVLEMKDDDDGGSGDDDVCARRVWVMAQCDCNVGSAALFETPEWAMKY
jgi:hypothetical protein